MGNRIWRPYNHQILSYFLLFDERSRYSQEHNIQYCMAQKATEAIFTNALFAESQLQVALMRI